MASTCGMPKCASRPESTNGPLQRFSGRPRARTASHRSALGPDVRDRPYMTEPARVQWGPLLSVALVALYLTLGRDPGRPWSAVLALVLALVILSRAFSAIRTQHVEFVVPSG